MNKYKWEAGSSRVAINKDKWDDISKMASRIFSPLNKFGDSCIKIFQFPVQLFFIISNVVQSQYLYLLVSGINEDYGRVNHWSIVLKISPPLDRHKGPPSPPPQPPSTPASALAFSLQSFLSTISPQPPWPKSIPPPLIISAPPIPRCRIFPKNESQETENIRSVSALSMEMGWRALLVSSVGVRM